jgi:general secretion pathway protein A
LLRVASPPVPAIDPSPAERFFGLTARPFSLTPDLRFAYHSRSHTRALEEVTSALRRREGLIVVTGAIGTGKTMLCRSMLETFESRTFLSVILDPGLEVEDLLRKVLTDFGIISGVEASATGPLSKVTRHEFVSTLQKFLASLIPLQAHAVIMVDEAQRLNPRVLEEIRLLSNFETDEAKLLQIVLVGQPELDDVLSDPKMQQLNQRVARRCELHPLSEREVGDYIDRRLTVASSSVVRVGMAETPPPGSEFVRFSPAAVKAVAGISGGIPRLVNTVCDRALDVACERQIRIVDADAVLAAAERLRLDVPGALNPRRARRPIVAAATAALLVLGLGAWLWTRAPQESPPRSTSIAAAPEPQTRKAESTDARPDAAPSAASATPAQAASATAPQTTASAPQAPASPRSPSAPANGTSGSTGGAFEIAVAAFRTEVRAQEVVTSLTGMRVPAAVRVDGSGTWYRVMAGPFPTRDAARSAQEALDAAGYGDTRLSAIVPGTR